MDLEAFVKRAGQDLMTLRQPRRQYEEIIAVTHAPGVGYVALSTYGVHMANDKPNETASYGGLMVSCGGLADRKTPFRERFRLRRLPIREILVKDFEKRDVEVPGHRSHIHRPPFTGQCPR